MPLDFPLQATTAQEPQALEFLSKYGNMDRRYRNGLGLAVPDATQVAALRSAKKYLKAIELVRGRRQQLNLTQGQLMQLRQRKQTEQTAYESAMRKLYETVWLPRVVGGQMQLEKVSVGGRPLAATGTQERLMELLCGQPPYLFSSIRPEKILELMHMGDGPDHTRAYDVKRVIDTFYSTPGFPRLDKEEAIRKAIAEGVKAGTFGYVRSADMLPSGTAAEHGGYLARRAATYLGVEIGENAVDADTGFIVVPSAIESEALPQPVVPTPQPSPTDTGVVYVTPDPHAPGTTPPVSTSPAQQETVELRLRVINRAQANVLATVLSNLASQAGSVEVTVEARKPGGFDPNWLHNAVREPLEEAEIEVEST